MNRQHVMMPHQYSSGNNNDNSTSRQSGNSLQPSTPSSSIYSQYHQLPHASISSHQLFSHSVDQAHRFDPRPTMLSSLHGSHVPPHSSMHFSEQQAYQPRRVSLLRDIGRAGERDRDSSTASNLIEERGLANIYSGGTSARHISTPPSPAVGVASTYDRPITMIGNMSHSHPTHVQQDSTHLGTTPAAHTISSLEVKKDSGLIPVKQELTSKNPNPLGQHPHQNVIQSFPTMQRFPNYTKPDQPLLSPVVEPKSKEDLVQAMDKMDRELKKVAAEITRLQKRQTQLEESAKKPPELEKEETSPQTAEPKHRDLWQIIYAENRKKAESARSVLDGHCPIYDLPLYNQPSDTKVFQENLKKNEKMRPKLVKFFQHRRKLSNIREKYLSARYDQMMDEWQKKVEKIESNVKRKAKEAKTREMFEKLFPEIRKQREQQERVERVGTRGDVCRSDADFAQIVDGLSEQENQLQHMRQLAVVPPMLLDKEERRVVFINHNGFINDPFAEFKESQQLDAWSDHEKAIFKEKYVQHPKNFQVIASFIEKKSVADCILYYYLTKKANNYKSLVRKHTLKPRKPKSGRAHTSHHHDQSSAGNNKDEKTDKDECKKEMEIEESKFDKPPSPRMTRARRQIINWTDEEINLVKEGFGKHGKDFSSISRMVTNKSEQQVKNFYHNYKKKHGLDQLITESKKKKTRTRHAALSPDASLGDDDVLSKPSDSSNESKNKSEKEKTVELEVADDKKKAKDRTPSPAVSISKSETVEVAASNTYRTRRTTAALAAAATLESQEKETNQNKRAGDKSQTLGEPIEKKAKKTERKSRTQKVSEVTRSDLAKSEAVRDVVASLSSTKPVADDKGEVASDADDQKSATETTSKGEAVSKKKEETEETEKNETEEEALVSTKDDSEATKASVQVTKEARATKKSEDHDSSATCSADEETHTLENIQVKDQVKSQPSRTTHVSSPYWFDDNPNEPLTIRLERNRVTDAPSEPTATTSTSHVISARPEAKSPVHTVLDLASKPPDVPPVVAAPTSNDARPQSLPPAPMVSASTTKSVWTTSPQVLPGLDLSRPSSTPVCPEPVKQPTKDFPPFHPFTQHQPETKPKDAAVFSTKAAVISTSSVAVKNIKELTYPGFAMKMPSSSVATPSSEYTSVVDLTRDGAAKNLAASHSQPESREAVSSSRHSYHVINPAGASLHKDFQPKLTSSTPPPVATHFPSQQRAYSEKSAIKDRAAAVPATPTIPVSSLRFPSNIAKTSNSQQKSSASTDQNESTRQLPVKEEIKQPPGLPSSLSAYSFAPRRNVSPARATLASLYPPVTSTPLSVVKKPEKPSAAVPDKPAPPKHVAISGGSITQGKPVFRAQFPQTGSLQDIKDSQKVAAATASARNSLSQRTPSPLVSGLPPGEGLNRRSSDAIESIFAANPGLLPTINPAHLQAMRNQPPFLPPSAIKVEKTSYPSISKSIVSDDLRHIISSSAPPGSIRPQDPHYLLGASSLSQLPVGSLPLINKPKEESLSPRAFAQRSTTPTSQAKGVDRKSSFAPSPVPDLPPRRPSPLVQQHPVESHFKDDVKRPASASRATPERRGFPEKPLGTHHRMSSTPHLPGPTKSRISSSVEGKSQEERILAAQLAEQQLLSAAALLNPALLGNNPAAINPALLANPGLLPNPSLLGGSLPPELLYQALLEQYRLGSALGPSIHPTLAAAAAASRFVQPFAGESRESSSNVIANDFQTARQMAAARNSPFSVALQTSVNPHVPPAPVGFPSTMLPSRHSGSPASMERLNFIPQHSGSIVSTSSRSSPHRSDPLRTPNPQSPSSPHSLLKSQLASGLFASPHETPPIPGSEKRPSASPHVLTPSPSQRAPSASFAAVSMALEGRQPSPLLYSAPAKHPLVSKASLSMPDNLSREQSLLTSTFTGSMPQLYRQTPSPASSQPTRSKPAKQERHLDHSELPHLPAATQRQYSCSPDQMARHFSSESGKANFRWEVPNKGSLDNQPKSKQSPVSQSGYSDAYALAKEKSDKQDLAYFGDPHHERAAKDLKTKGCAKITPKILINTIIDLNINQYAANQDKTKQKSLEGLTSQAVDRKMIESKLKEKAPDIDTQFHRMSPKTPPSEKGTPYHAPYSRTTTLREHSNDIISNMYRWDPDKLPVSESKSVADLRKQEDLMNTLISSVSPRFNLPTTISNEQLQKRHDFSPTRSKILMHPFTPQVMNMQQSTTIPLESIIRKALMSDASASAPAGSSSPAAEGLRQNRTDSSSSGHSAPGVRPSTFGFHQEKNPTSSFSNNSAQESKRTESQFSRNSPAPSAPPQMFSALSFRKGQANPPSQQIPAPTNMTGRPVLPVGSNTGAAIGIPSVFHPQTTPALSEKNPPPSNQYEPLSDDDD